MGDWVTFRPTIVVLFVAVLGSAPVVAPSFADDRRNSLSEVMRTPSKASWPASVSAEKKSAVQEDCDIADHTERALALAAKWMAEFPREKLRFDAAIGLHFIRKIVDNEALQKASETARLVADKDHDHPQRRFWIADFKSPPAVTSQWAVPSSAESRVSPDKVLHEALYCGESGWRPETTKYVCGLMRDNGGYLSVHALWALTIARENGCLLTATCLPELQKELIDSQPKALAPMKTLDIDLFAERLLMLVRSGASVDGFDQWARTLLDLQGTDGSWGVAAPGEDPYFRYHATQASTWALAEWARQEGTGHNSR